MDAPPLGEAEPMRVGLMVEPTPFTHVSGYANRFNEMLRMVTVGVGKRPPLLERFSLSLR